MGKKSWGEGPGLSGVHGGGDGAEGVGRDWSRSWGAANASAGWCLGTAAVEAGAGARGTAGTGARMPSRSRVGALPFARKFALFL